ncbi:MAG: alpha/beta hydrolase [Acidimicrobiales bacterium]
MPDDTGPPIETFSLRTSDGLALEAEARIPADATIAALLAHPHPLHGGSMRSLVTSELFRSLPERGVAVVRFNFRGVEGSDGTHGQGVDEQHDLVAGLDALTERVPGLPLVILGWSFGADVGLTVVDPRLAGWFLIAPPIRVVRIEAMAAAHDPRPKRLAVPEHDEFRPPGSAREVTADWVNTTIEVVAGADHYLAGRTGKVADLFSAFATELSANS